MRFWINLLRSIKLLLLSFVRQIFLNMNLLLQNFFSSILEPVTVVKGHKDLRNCRRRIEGPLPSCLMMHLIQEERETLSVPGPDMRARARARGEGAASGGRRCDGTDGSSSRGRSRQLPSLASEIDERGGGGGECGRRRRRRQGGRESVPSRSPRHRVTTNGI